MIIYSNPLKAILLHQSIPSEFAFFMLNYFLILILLIKSFVLIKKIRLIQ